MDLVWAELAAGVPDATHLVRATIRLLTSICDRGVCHSKAIEAVLLKSDNPR
jgi:hypothetical protein